MIGTTRNVFLLACLLCMLWSMAASSGPAVWVVSGMERVRLEDAPGKGRSITLRAARGEYESFQIVIRAQKGQVTNANVTVTDLSGPDGAVIPASRIALFREHYVNVKHQSTRCWKEGVPTAAPDAPGWFPDALIPFIDPATGKPPEEAQYRAAPFAVEEGKNQPVWADVFVPRDAAPGEYRGRYTVSCDQGTKEGEVRLTVWNFELPLKPSLKTCFDLWNDRSVAACETLLRNRIMPKSIPPAHARRFMNEYGLSLTHAGFWSGADVSKHSMKPSPSVGEFREARMHYPPDMEVYNYTADEIVGAGNLYGMIKDWARNMHEAGIKNLITMAPVPELFDDGSGKGRTAVDIWCLQPNYYYSSTELVAEAKRRGQEIWAYTALVQDHYSPKWLIDFPPIHHRMMQGFIGQQLAINGLLVWCVDYWTKDPWVDVDYVHKETQHYPAEGMTVYPGAPAGCRGVVPSIRLKWIREGVEDYEYIELYKKLVGKEKALEVCRPVAADFMKWSQNVRLLEKTRRKMGEELGES